MPMTLEQIANANALIDLVDPFCARPEVEEAPTPERAVLPVLLEPPVDEGAPVDTSVVAPIAQRVTALPDAAITRIGVLQTEAAQRGTPFHMTTPTERRAAIVDALFTLGANDSLGDSDLRLLVASAVQQPWPYDDSLTTGAVVGLLDAASAVSFRTLVDALMAGQAQLQPDGYLMAVEPY
jgi:hypothetical protein